MVEDKSKKTDIIPIVIFICFVSVILLLMLFMLFALYYRAFDAIVEGKIPIDKLDLKMSDGFIGATATLIGIMVTFVIGYQILNTLEVNRKIENFQENLKTVKEEQQHNIIQLKKEFTKDISKIEKEFGLFKEQINGKFIFESCRLKFSIRAESTYNYNESKYLFDLLNSLLILINVTSILNNDEYYYRLYRDLEIYKSSIKSAMHSICGSIDRAKNDYRKILIDAHKNDKIENRYDSNIKIYQESIIKALTDNKIDDYIVFNEINNSN